MKKNRKIIILATLGTVVTYLTVCLSISLSNLFHMVHQNNHSRHTEIGENRINEIKKAGIKYEYSLYTKEEISNNKNLEKSKLYYFPAPGGVKTDYAIVVPGGGYFECDVNKVALPCAATINKLGYTSFVLAYRYGKYSSKYAPIEDLARAIKFITTNADKFNVNPKNYCCVGFSAGGNLVGNFASETLGYKKYGVSKPKAVALVYPWININGKTPFTGNVFQELLSLSSKSIGNRYLLGNNATEKEKSEICVQNNVTKSYPATYLIHGNKDFVVPHKQNAEIMVDALKKNSVPHKYKLCRGLNHGFGLGVGTSAEGWVTEAIGFWKNQ